MERTNPYQKMEFMGCNGKWMARKHAPGPVVQLTLAAVRVLKLAIQGPSVLPAVHRVLNHRFDRIVSLQVGPPSGSMTRNAKLWADEWRAEKELLLNSMLRECCAVEELELSAVGLTDREAGTLAAALRGLSQDDVSNPDSCVHVHRPDVTQHAAPGRRDAVVDNAEKILADTELSVGSSEICQLVDDSCWQEASADMKSVQELSPSTSREPVTQNHKFPKYLAPSARSGGGNLRRARPRCETSKRTSIHSSPPPPPPPLVFPAGGWGVHRLPLGTRG